MQTTFIRRVDMLHLSIYHFPRGSLAHLKSHMLSRNYPRTQATLGTRVHMHILTGGRSQGCTRMMPTLSTHASCRSNTLFALWNSYAKRLAPSYFTQQLLATGDLLYQAQVSVHMTACVNSSSSYLILQPTNPITHCFQYHSRTL